MTSKEIILNRFIAKGIDFFIVGFIWTFLSFIDASFLGMFAGIGYLLIADGFFEGQSLGKKIIKLKVMVIKDDQPVKCTYKSSILRNAILAVIMFSSIPIIGWFILAPLGVLIIAIEAYFAYTDEKNRRIGDVLAGTFVEDASGAKMP